MEDPGKECDKDGGGEVDDGRQTHRSGICQPEILRRTLMMMMMVLECLVM